LKLSTLFLVIFLGLKKSWYGILATLGLIYSWSYKEVVYMVGLHFLKTCLDKIEFRIEF